MIKAVAFDLDGTLLNRSESIRHYCDYFVLEHLDCFENNCDTAEIAEKMYHFYRNGLSKTPEYYQSVIRNFQWSMAPSPVYLDQHYRECMITFCIPQNNIYTTMRALKSMEVEFGIVTNGIAINQRRKIERLNLHRIVDTILVSGELGVAKPDPAIFETFCSEKEVKLEEVLFVGDDPKRDVLGAQNAGMKTAWFSDNREWQEGDYQPDLIVDDLLEIIEWVKNHNHTKPLEPVLA